MDYKNKKITIFGLGIYEKGSGISAALFFAEKGAMLTITDTKTEKDLRHQIKRLQKYSQNIKYILGRHRTEDFKNADLIFKNPSVPKDSPYLKIARENKIPIINDWTIFFEERPNNLLIGITGTKGKSTTTSLIYHLLKTAKKDAVLCGNIGQSPLAILKNIKKNTIVVAELSSWLLQEFKQSPQISVITNLMADHLDKYKNIKDYFEDKKNIFRFQNKNDNLILNKNDKNLKKFGKKAKSRVVWSNGTPEDTTAKIAGLLNISKDNTQKALKTFKRPWGRLQFVKEKNGIKYYNDTTATTPDATIYALQLLKEYRRNIVLIAGGMDKKLDYKELAAEIPKYAKALVLFKGSASEKLLKDLKFKNKNLKINVGTMKDAVRSAEKFSGKKDIILLSPSAASFNMFKNEFDRGEQFIKTIK